MRHVVTLLVAISCITSQAAGQPAVRAWDLYAELMAWTAKHSHTLQVSVPSGRTVDAIKTDVVALANAIIAKLP